jgi:regulator of cell morphogenesis and NO signaling
MSEVKEKAVGEIVKDNFKAADVFSKHGIDFCCGGKIGLEQACNESGSDVSTVVSELNELENQVGAGNFDFDSWELSFLIDFIVNTHHNYIRKAIPEILPLAQKVAEVHGDIHPEVIKINELFTALAEELMSHMEKEEQILFPIIKKLTDPSTTQEEIDNFHCGSVDGPISVMEAEHDNAGDILKEISKLSSGYTLPEGGCNTYRVLYGKLNEFENDLHRQIHLENNILFPKSLQLEVKGDC